MKNASVTGDSRGIGLAIAKQLAAEEFQLILVARSIDQLKEISTSLPGTNHKCLQADLSLNNDIDKLVIYISEQKYDAGNRSSLFTGVVGMTSLAFFLAEA